MVAAEPPNVPDGAPAKLRIHACQRLLRWVGAHAEEWTAGQDLRGHDMVLLTVFARSTRTYEAIVRWLAENGFGEQGIMLNRSLFEDMVDAHWIHLNPDLAVDRLVEHDLYSRLLRADVQRRFPAWFDHEKPPAIKVTNDKRKELKDLFGKTGSRSWTGIPHIEDRLEGVISCWPESDHDQVRFWAAWVVKMMNEVLHPSALSIGRFGAPRLNDNDNLEWRFGATPERLTESLHGALWTYSQTVGLIVDRYAPGEAQTGRDLFAQAHLDFRRARHWERTGRLEALPDDGPDPPGAPFAS